MRTAGALLALLGLLAPAATAEERDPPLCGTFPGRSRLELAKHDFAAERLARERTGRFLGAPRLEVDGDLVLLSDDGSIVAEENRFDLGSRSLVFSPAGERFLVRSESGAVEPGLGTRVTIGDDVTRSFDLPFEFPFLGGRYRRLYLNSDGNVTFVRGDSASSPRSLERFLSGPPRIAALFTDLDPSAKGQVRAANLPDRFVATWDGVPEWEKETPNTFQVELHPNGTIVLRFGGDVAVQSAIVGVSPGGEPPSVNLVDLSRGTEELAGATAERFLRGRSIDNVALAKSFYRSLEDRYDSLVVWTNFESDLDDAFAFATLVQNAVQGIGEDIYDDSRLWGSDGALEGFVFMGNLRRYPRSPGDRVLGAASRPTTLGLLGHEVGHRFLARAFVSKSGVPRDALLGRQDSHWSFFLDTDASFLEGNDIEPESANRFRTVETVTRYSMLDLYLMGLAPASEVSPFFLITGAAANLFGEPLDHESTPRVGVTITGTQTNLTIDDIVRGMGPREPGFDVAPSTFRHAWVLLTRGGEPPTSADIAQLQEAREAFLAFFRERTLGRGNLVTEIAR